MVQNFKTPRAHNYSLSIQQEIARNNVLTIGYSGQHGQDLAINRDLNASPLGSGGDHSDRPYFSQFPNLRHIVQTTNLGDSQYDSLQASYNQRDWHGLDTAYNFTWSKCFDESSFNRGGTGDYPQLQNPLSIADNRGLCDHDVRLNFNVSGVYSFPTIPHLGERLGKGWQLSTIYTAISGRPFSVLLGGGADPSGQGLSGSSIRAAWDGTPVKYNTRNPAQYVVENVIAGRTAGVFDPCGRQNFDDTAANFLSGDMPFSPFYIPCPGTVGNSQPQSTHRSRPQPVGHDVDEEHQNHRPLEPGNALGGLQHSESREFLLLPGQHLRRQLRYSHQDFRRRRPAIR